MKKKPAVGLVDHVRPFVFSAITAYMGSLRLSDPIPVGELFERSISSAVFVVSSNTGFPISVGVIKSTDGKRGRSRLLQRINALVPPTTPQYARWIEAESDEIAAEIAKFIVEITGPVLVVPGIMEAGGTPMVSPKRSNAGRNGHQTSVVSQKTLSNVVEAAVWEVLEASNGTLSMMGMQEPNAVEPEPQWTLTVEEPYAPGELVEEVAIYEPIDIAPPTLALSKGTPDSNGAVDYDEAVGTAEDLHLGPEEAAIPEITGPPSRLPLVIDDLLPRYPEGRNLTPVKLAETVSTLPLTKNQRRELRRRQTEGIRRTRVRPEGDEW